MSEAIAGIYAPDASSSDSRATAMVERALEGEGEAVVRRLGALTLGWAGASVFTDGSVTCVLSGSADPQVVVAAYRRLGDDAPASLRDDFTLVLWDEQAQRGLLARDQLGLNGLFFSAVAGGTAFATEVRTLLRLLPSRPSPDDVAVVHWLARGSEVDGRTFYDGIARLPAAGRVVLEKGWRSDRYWVPRYTPPARMEPQQGAELLRTELEKSVRRAAGQGSVGVMLSGGFDSGYVASVAARTGLAPRAYSAVFPDHPSVDEAALIERLTAELAIPGHSMPVGAANPFPAAFEYVREWQLPLPSMGHYYSRDLLLRAARDGVDVVLDGEGGDEAFEFEPHLIADLLLAGHLARAASITRALVRPGPSRTRRALRLLGEDGLRAAAPYGLHRALRTRRDPSRYAPVWLNERSARLFRNNDDPWTWKRVAGPRWWAHRLHLIVDGAEALGVGDYLRRRARQAGVTVRHPLMSIDLVELALSLSPELALGEGHDRALARLSATGVMPEPARLRREKSYFNELYNDCLAQEIELLRDLLLGPDAELRAYTQPEHVRTLLEHVPPPERRPVSGWAPQIWRLASMEIWLRAQADPEYPERAMATAGAAGRL